MSDHIEGLIAAPFTPFGPDGALDLDTIGAQADLLGRNGLAGAFICGTTGEGVSMSESERMAVAERWVRAAPDGFKIIVHVGQNSLSSARALAAHARQIGAWGVGAMSPCFFKPASVEVLLEWLARLGDAAPDLPLYFYHIPSMTGVSFPMVELLEGAVGRIPNLAGIKYTWEDLMDYQLCRRVAGGRFDMEFGRDEILLSALPLGATGAIGSTFNYAPGLYTGLIAALNDGDLDKARGLQDRSMDLVRVLGRHGGVRCGKTIMKLAGLDCGPCRAPLADVSADETRAIGAELERIGFFDYCAK